MTLGATTPVGAASDLTTAGAQGQENAFQSLFEAGAFDPNDRVEKPRDEQAPPAERAAQQSAEQGTDQDGEQAPAWSSFDEFLSAAKADPEAVKALPVKVKVDGQELEVPLAEVLSGYSRTADYTQKTQALAAERAQHQTEAQAARQLYAQQLTQGKALGDAALQMLNQDFGRVDWNALRVQNPAEFAALHAEYQTRQAQIGQYLQAVQQRQAEVEQQSLAQSQQRLAQERELMLKAMPEWKDPEKFDKDRASIAQFARSLGFTDAELNGITDHRLMRMAHAASQYAALQAKAPNAVQQVRQAPPITAKPGARQASNPAAAQRQQAMERFNRNPRDMDAQAAAFEYLAGSGA